MGLTSCRVRDVDAVEVLSEAKADTATGEIKKQMAELLRVQ